MKSYKVFETYNFVSFPPYPPKLLGSKMTQIFKHMYFYPVHAVYVNYVLKSLGKDKDLGEVKQSPVSFSA